MSKVDRITHTLNKSLSKATYSFPKTKRFLPRIKTCSSDVFYDIPDYKNKRSTSFGIGSKQTLIVNSQIPPPGAYYQPYDSSSVQKRKGFSFGYGRYETVGGPLDNSRHSSQIPGPGYYPIMSTLQTPLITLKPRLTDLTLKTKQYVPGPGTYDPPKLINAYGNYVQSTHINSRASKFSQSKQTLQTRQSLTPGPGYYGITQSINKQGRYHTSKYENSHVRSFCKSSRPSLALRHMRDLPGPGKYKVFSQFE